MKIIDMGNFIRDSAQNSHPFLPSSATAEQLLNIYDFRFHIDMNQTAPSNAMLMY